MLYYDEKEANNMEVIVAIAAYLFQIFCICALAAVFCFIIIGPLLLMKVKMNKRTVIISFLLALLVLCAALSYVCENPIVNCPDEYADVVTDEQLRNVQSIAAGVYSEHIPLIPVLARIEKVQWMEEYSGFEIRFRINYLFFGSETLVMGGDGISVVKPLGRQ